MKNQEITDSYLTELISEKEALESTLKHAPFLIAQEIDRVQTSSKKMIELHNNKPTKVSTKVRIPVKEFPMVNFVGKIIGPKGTALKQLQEETGTKIIVQGRGSIRDKAKEDDLRREGGKHSHLHEELHVVVEAFGDPSECHKRIAITLQKLSQFFIQVTLESGTESHSIAEADSLPHSGIGRGLPPPHPQGPPPPGWIPPHLRMPPSPLGRGQPPRPMHPPPRPGWPPNGRAPLTASSIPPRPSGLRPSFVGPPRSAPPPNGFPDYGRPRDHTVIPAGDYDFTDDSWPVDSSFNRSGKAPTSWPSSGHQRPHPYL